MGKHRLLRVVSLVLTTILIFTSVPQQAYASAVSGTADALIQSETEEEPGAEGTEEAQDESELKDDDSLSEGEETQNNMEESETDEEICEAIADESEIDEEDSQQEEADSQEEVIAEENIQEEVIITEDKAMAADLSFSDSTASIDKIAEEGWSWDAATKTLTLDGASIINPVVFYSDARINVISDSSIEVESGRAINLTGEKGNNLEITGNGKLALSTKATNNVALCGNNDGHEHNITISGGSLMVECTNKSSSGRAIYAVKGHLTVKDGATLLAYASNNAINCLKEAYIDVENGAVLDASSDGAVALAADNAMHVSVSGSSTLNVTSDTHDAICCNGNATFDIEDGAIMSVTSGSRSAFNCYKETHINVSNKAFLNVVGNGLPAAIYSAAGSLLMIDVTDGGCINSTTKSADAIYFYEDKGYLNVSGEGSALNVSFSDHSRSSGVAVSSSKNVSVKITDSGRLTVHDVIPGSGGLINIYNGELDLRGGIVSASTYPGREFEKGRSVMHAKTLLYDTEALNNTYFSDSVYSFGIFVIEENTDSFIYADMLQITSPAKTKYGVKTGDSLTLSVEAKAKNTDETPVFTYQWYKDGVAIAGATDATYITPALTDGIYTYKCDISATFSVGKIKKSTENTTVYVNSKGRTTSDTVLSINDETESADNLAEDGWAWDKEKAELTLDNAVLKQIVIDGVSATIINSGDSVISSSEGKALTYGGEGKTLDIKGTGSLTFEDTDTRFIAQYVVSGRDASVGGLTISGDSLTVNCTSENGLGSAIEVYNKLSVTDGAVLNIDSKAGNGISVKANSQMVVEKGSKLNISTVVSPNTKTAIQLGDNSVITFTGAGTEVILDTDAERNIGAIKSNSGTLKVKDHAKLTINNCESNMYEEIDFLNGGIDIVGGILELNAPMGKKFPDDKRIIRVKKGQLLYNEAGLMNSYKDGVSGYDFLFVKSETAKWTYKGDAPYIVFVKQPSNTYVVNGNEATLSAEVEIFFGEDDQVFTYQWYKDGIAIPGATEATYTTDKLVDVSNDYYCIAGATVGGADISAKSDVITVAANFSGKAVRKEALRLTESDTKSEVNETEGWSWDKDKKILTLDNFTMRMPYGYYGVEIPSGTTIVLKGTNRIDMDTNNYNIYARGASGKIVFMGDGSLEMTNPTTYGIYTQHGIDVLGSIVKGDVNVYNMLTGETSVSSILNSVSGVYESKIVADGEPGILFKDAEKRIFTASQNGEAPKITVEAELVGATGAVSYQYQWYASDKWNNPQENAVAVGKGATLTAPVKERGGKYYYCEVTATYNKKTYKKISDIYSVVTGAKGLLPLTEKTYLGGSSVDHMADQGWSYDASTHTLTLDNLEAFIPFAKNSDTYYLFSITGEADKEIKVVLKDGSVNHITECCYGLVCTAGNALTFTGKGTLNYESGPEACRGLIYLTTSFADINIAGGSKLNVYGEYNCILNDKVNITVENAEATFDYLFNSSYAGKSNVHIAKDGKLSVVGPGEKYVKDLRIDNGGALYVSGSSTGLVIGYGTGDGTLDVAGVLSVAAEYAAINIYGVNPESRMNISDSVILVPEAKTISELHMETIGDRSYYCNGNLLIAPSDYKRTDISGVPVVTGEMSVGSRLVAGDVLPAGATVSCKWQYALSKDAADEFWEDTGVTGATFDIKERYVDKYIRVKITGFGQYKGTVYSRPTVPVAGNSVTLADFVVEDIHYGRISSESINYSPVSFYPQNINGQVYVKAVADDKNANIVIKNITEGFDALTDEEKTINGAEGTMPVYISGGTSTNNTISITVTNGTKKAVYKANIYYQINTGGVTLSADKDVSLVLSDLDDNVYATAKYPSTYGYADIKAGTECKVTAISERSGWYVSSITNEQYGDKSEAVDGKQVIIFKVPNARGISFGVSDSKLRCVAPEATVEPVTSSIGFSLKVQWDTPVPAIYAEPDYTGRICAELLDENGNKVRVREDPSNPEGFTEYWGTSGIITPQDDAGNDISIDPGKEYTLKLWYDNADKEKCDIQEITIPSSTLSLNRHHVVIEKPTGASVDTIVNVDGKVFDVQVFPGTVTPDKVLVDHVDGDQFVTVTVSKDAEAGTVYAMVYIKRGLVQVIGEVLTIDIIEPSAEVKAGLSVTSGSMNIYGNDEIVLPVNIIGSDKQIIGAKFVDSNNAALSDKFYINSLGDREVVIAPYMTGDADEVDWAAVAKSYTGSFKAKIEVELTGGAKYVTDEYYALKVTAKAPKVTASAIKFNSFYQEDTVKIAFKAGSNVVEARVDEVKTTSKIAACPEWVKLEDSGRSVVLINSKLTNRKGAGKLFLKVWLDGYRVPAQISIPVTAAYAEPKLKLSQNTITLPNNRAKYAHYTEINVVSANKNMSLKDLNVTQLRVAKLDELAELSSAEKKLYAASQFYAAYSYDQAKGAMKLETVAGVTQMPAGKVLLYAEIAGNPLQKVALPLTIKSQADSNVTVKMSKKSITLNSNKATGTETISIELIPSALCYDCSGATLKVTDTKGNGDYADKLTISQSEYMYYFSTNEKTTDGTYRVSITVPGIAKPAVVDVAVKKSVPVLKAEKNAVSIDLFGDYKESRRQELALTLSDNTISSTVGNYTSKVYDSKRAAADDKLNVYFTSHYGKDIAAVIDASYYTVPGKYTVELIYNMPGSGVTSVAKVMVNVVEKLPKLKASKSSVTLNSSLGKTDMATVKFAMPDNYSYSGYDITVLDKNNKSVANVVGTEYNCSTGILTMYAGPDAVAGQNYKLKVETNVVGKVTNKYVTNIINVKIAALNRTTGKTAITQKLAVKGTMDIARTESVMQVVPSYVGWNQAVTSDAYNVPVISWKVFAYKNNTPYQYGDVLYQYAGDTGKVADSDDTLNWFTDVDPSDAISLGLDYSSKYVQEIAELIDLSYKVEVTTTYPNYYGPGQDLVLTSTAPFKVKNGTVKFSTSQPASVFLNKNDRFDSKIIKVKMTDADAMSQNIREVSIKGNSVYDATLLYVGGDYAYVAVGWKNDTIPSQIKTGKLTLEFYTGYNFVGRSKCNGTAVVTVQ